MNYFVSLYAMTRFLLLSIFLYLPLLACFAEETSPVRITAKPFLNSFTQMRADLRRDTIIYKQEKIIFGLDVKINEYWSARVGVDLIRMNKPYLKPTVLTYKKDRWTVDGGIFFTSEMDKTMSQYWNNRFIDRVASDKWLHDPTADLGVRVTYRWNDFINTDVSLVSGSGYQHLNEKYHPKPAFRAIITPIQPLKLGGYISARKADVTETTFNFFAHLQTGDQWNVTGEFHHQDNCWFAEGHRMNLGSVYGTYNLLSWLGLMGRYDYIHSNKAELSGESWNVLEDGHLFIGGLIFQCFPTVRVSVDYWSKRSAVRRIEKEDWLYVCLEFKY